MSFVLTLTGTTGFPLLEQHMIQLASTHRELKILLQSPNQYEHQANVEWSRFLDLETLATQSINLVIGHCGAGTVFWALDNRLPLIAVIDLERADTHQKDLGDWLSSHNFSLVLTNRGPTREEIHQAIDCTFETYQKDRFDISRLQRYLPKPYSFKS